MSFAVRRRASVAFTLALLLPIGCDGDGGGDAGVDASSTDAAPPACDFDPGAPEDIPEPEVYTPRWAFEPWISKDISDRDDSYAFVDGFMSRDIPVGVLVLDSPWDVNYTTFQPNPDRYPEFGAMVSDMHDRGVRVVMWVTQMTNVSSFDAETGGDTYRGRASNYNQGCACGYFVEDCKLYNWWKGNGSGVDFFNPNARIWWHRQQDDLLDMGIDGWKLDFGESYMEADQTLSTFSGPIPHQQYSEEYYRDYLAYGRFRRGREFVTMVRPYDVSYDRIGRFHARPEHSPVAWVGDNHRDWTGLIDALDEIFLSADAGYVVLGSDMGGYLDRDQDNLTQTIPFDLEVFQRWVAVGAMMPFMQLHGRANLAPWTVEGDVDATVASYRYWATLHHEMVDYWYSITEEAYGTSDIVLRPQGERAAWAGDYRYVIGEAFLVAPILDNGGVRDVALPADERWYDWYDPSGDALDGGTTLTAYDASATGRIPLFVREGAIVPVHVDNDATGLGDASSAGHLTLLVWPSTESTSFRLHEPDDITTTIQLTRGAAGDVTLSMSRTTEPVIVRMRADAAPSAVSVGGTPLSMVADRAALFAAGEGWAYDAASKWVWIEVPMVSGSLGIEVAP
ncbi:MAG: TIM-barrel domain-containing protein [Sandaracinaceae bacterium]